MRITGFTVKLRVRWNSTEFPPSLKFHGETFSFARTGDLVDKAKRAPGSFNYASPGVGTPQHLSMELLKETTGIDVLHIPHKGMGGAVISIAGGEVELGFVPIQSALPHIESERMIPLAVSSIDRSADLPEVPTIAESINKDYEVDLWYGLFAPAGTSPAIIETLNKESHAVLAIPAFKEQLDNMALVAAPGTPSELAALIASDTERWEAVINAAKVSAD